MVASHSGTEAVESRADGMEGSGLELGKSDGGRLAFGKPAGMEGSGTEGDDREDADVRGSAENDAQTGEKRSVLR